MGTAVVEYASQVMLVTGLQGSGKTLSTIVRVKEWAESTKRPVYYYGIRDLADSLGWHKLDDPNLWFEAPEHSIVVIDEAQQHEFDRGWKPPKGSGAGAIPRAVAEMATLRHRGQSLVLITQGPMLLNANVRRLCGLHFHSVRAFGMQVSNIYEWHKVETDPDSAAAKRQAILHVFKYPKWAFELYKSAEVHTIKRRIPTKVKIIVALPFILGGVGWYGYHYIVTKKLGSADRAASVSTSATPGTSGTLAGPNAKPKAKTVREFLDERTPRLPGLAMTAPVYDKVMEPKTAPKPVACVASKSHCGCYTQQGTKMPEVPELTCRSIVENGYFDDTVDPREARGQFFDRQDRSAQLVAAREEPSRVGADQPDGRAVPSAPVRAERPWPADPAWRQTVTSPGGAASNGGPSTRPKLNGGQQPTS